MNKDDLLYREINALAASLPGSCITQSPEEIVISFENIKLSFYAQDKFNDSLVCIFSIADIEFHIIDVFRAAAEVWPNFIFHENSRSENLSDDQTNLSFVRFVCNTIVLAGPRLFLQWQDWFLIAVRFASERISSRFPQIAVSFEKSALDIFNQLNLKPLGRAYGDQTKRG